MPTAPPVSSSSPRPAKTVNGRCSPDGLAAARPLPSSCRTQPCTSRCRTRSNPQIACCDGRATEVGRTKATRPAQSSPAPVAPIGQAHILYLIRDSNHPSRLETFHTISSAWAPFAYDGPANIERTAAWGTGILLAHESDGRIHFEAAELKSNKRSLQALDWFIVVIYLGAMLGMGGYFYLRAKKGSTADFFVGGRSIPFWAAGVSIYATNTSSISYVATPAKAFETDWQYMTGKIVTVIGLMFVAVWVVPVLRRLNLVSVFNYLEMRFNRVIRMLASALCMLMHVGSRMSVVLFLPALAISTITGTPVVWSILRLLCSRRRLPPA